MPRKKRYLVQEVRPDDEGRIKNHPDVPIQRCCINGEEEKIVLLSSMADGGIIQNPKGTLYGERTNEQTISKDALDALLRDEIEKEEAKKPPVMTEPRDLAGVLLGRLGGLDVKAEPAPMSFPIRVGPTEAETDYGLTISLRAENRQALAGVINAAIRAGQQDILAGPVVLYLYAVQGHDRTKTSANGLPYVELKYIFRLRETTPKQEV